MAAIDERAISDDDHEQSDGEEWTEIGEIPDTSQANIQPYLYEPEPNESCTVSHEASDTDSDISDTENTEGRDDGIVRIGNTDW